LGDFYCDEALSGRAAIQKVAETEGVLAFRHTRPHWTTHIVVVPKRHIASLTALSAADDALVLELLGVVREVAGMVEAEQGGAHVVTNVGKYQDSKHLHFHVYAGEVLQG